MKKSDSDYIAHTIQYAVKNRITVHLLNKPSIKTDDSPLPYGGYFCSDGRILATATGVPFKKWFPTFVHEACHMDQFLEDSKYWNITLLKNGECAHANLFEWIEGRMKLTPKQAKRYAYLSGQLELDCEKRVIEKIKEWGLSIDPDQHTREANCYVLFYNFIAKYRVWTKPKRSAYKYKEIVDKMSPRFDYDYRELPKWFEKAVLKYCFDNKPKPIPMEI